MSFDLDLTYLAGERERHVRLVSEARTVAITGPSGSGKTSLLGCIAGLRRPLSGHVRIGDATQFDAAAGVDLPPEERRAGYVFQDLRLFPHRTVAANLTYGHRSGAVMTPAEAMDFLGIAALASRMPATLSGGEAKRVAIGRALVSAPRFLLLDEPLTSLDPQRAEEVLWLLERIGAELGLPTLLVSHSPIEVEWLAEVVVALD
ncbi:ATP-binding cassette domain-containing protein [Altererythrobacter salegens]|uniref:ATP-binding cassette domain-containing protein n=1 Tax=Croceibacterium salegens TaxID=1737568 RepID=A0A6I4SXW0_9SPHN|nr:ATP-binding cassette domain-containing protein [Croceibacterium salegens]MXO60841.1 ATP-binding cassette domain-containing protein [Croceibacterium salegens]